jgi:HEAT repeats
MKIIAKSTITILLLLIVENFGFAQMLNQELKYAIEKVSKPTIDDCYCAKEIDFLLKQPAIKMLPIFEDLLYGRISRYSLTTWNENEAYAKRFYSSEAALMLGKMKNSEALNILRKWIDMQPIPESTKKFEYGEDSALKAAMEAIGYYKQPEDVTRLCRFSSYPEWSVRTFLAKIIGTIGGKNAIQLLHKMMLEDSNLSVRVTAITALKDCGDQSILSDLKAIYADPNSFPHPNDKKIIKETIEAIESRVSK